MPTTPGGRFSPGDADDWDLTTDLAAMQVSNETASANEIAAAIAANAPTLAYRVGTNAQRLAIPLAQRFEGLTFYTTDTRITWVYDSATWKNRSRSLCSYTTSTPAPAATFIPSWTDAGRITDTNSYWNVSSPTRITIPFTGIYEFTYSLRTNGVAGMSVGPQVNGTAVPRLAASSSGVSGAATHVQFAGVESFNAGDYITLNTTYGTSGGSATYRIGLNYLGQP